MIADLPAQPHRGPAGGRCRLRPAHLAWAGLIGLALALRLAGLAATSVWHDEAVSIQVARMGVYDVLVSRSVAANQVPLMYLLLKLWAVVSWAPLWLRLLPVVLSLGGVVFGVLWVRQWDRTAGWTAGLLAATAPLMVHYAQELRAYALLYTCLLGGLYFAERLARADTRSVRTGLLACACAMTYAHYVGLLATVALWLYALLRGVRPRRVAMLACAWAALVLPTLALGVYHVLDKQETGYWIAPLTPGRLLELAASWTGHATLALWEESAAGGWVPWAALVGRALLGAGLGTALLVSLAAGPLQRRRGAVASLAASLAFLAQVVVISLAAVSIGLQRTTFPVFIPLIGALALSHARCVPRWAGPIGRAACLLVTAVWATGWLFFVRDCPERRPQEQALFQAVAERFQPGDVLIVFTPELQVSAGYFLRDVARAEQIHTTELSRLEDGPRGLMLRPVPRAADSTWFNRFRLAVRQHRDRHLRAHAVWLVDLGMRSAGDPDRARVCRWLDERYARDAVVSVGSRWTLSARRFVPRPADRQALTADQPARLCSVPGGSAAPSGRRGGAGLDERGTL